MIPGEQNESGERNETDSSISLAARATVTEYEDGFAIKFNEETRHGFLRWQAGKLVSEFRAYRDPGMSRVGFRGTVSLFFLLGYGATRDEALTMARRKTHGRNGR